MALYTPKGNGKYEVDSPYSSGTKEIEAKKLPNGEYAEPLKEYEVRLLKNIPSGEGWDYEEGKEYKVHMTPACEWYLISYGTCFKTGAEKGEDFEFINF